MNTPFDSSLFSQRLIHRPRKRQKRHPPLPNCSLGLSKPANGATVSTKLPIIHHLIPIDDPRSRHWLLFKMIECLQKKLSYSQYRKPNSLPTWNKSASPTSLSPPKRKSISPIIVPKNSNGDLPSPIVPSPISLATLGACFKLRLARGTYLSRRPAHRPTHESLTPPSRKVVEALVYWGDSNCMCIVSLPGRTPSKGAKGQRMRLLTSPETAERMWPHMSEKRRAASFAGHHAGAATKAKKRLFENLSVMYCTFLAIMPKKAVKSVPLFPHCCKSSFSNERQFCFLPTKVTSPARNESMASSSSSSSCSPCTEDGRRCYYRKWKEPEALLFSCSRANSAGWRDGKGSQL